MKAVVTGASGFVGGHLVRRLVSEGLDVRCLVRPRSYVSGLCSPGVETRTVNFEDPACLSPAMEGAGVVFHVAGLTRARTTAQYMRANVNVTRNLLWAAQRSSHRLERFVYVSSLAAAGPNPTPIPLDEDSPARPLPGYGSSKLAAERVVLRAGDRVPVSIVRPPAVYGPGDSNFLPMFCCAYRYGIAPIVGSPSKQLSLVHVADLAHGILLAGTHPRAQGRVYFIDGGIHTLDEFISAMEGAIGTRISRLRLPAFLARFIGEVGEIKWTVTGKPQIVCRRKVEDMLQDRWTCTSARAEREIGYRPAVDLVQGVRETAQWYAGQGLLRNIRSGDLKAP
jgi:nucleoside-diphosphate-sugar epimerase